MQGCHRADEGRKTLLESSPLIFLSGLPLLVGIRLSGSAFWRFEFYFSKLMTPLMFNNVLLSRCVGICRRRKDKLAK